MASLSRWNTVTGLHLVSLRLLLSFQVPTHNRINVDPPIESGSREDRRIPRTPLDIKAPLTPNGQLIHHLSQKERRQKHNTNSLLLSPNYLPTASVSLYLHVAIAYKSLIFASWRAHLQPNYSTLSPNSWKSQKAHIKLDSDCRTKSKSKKSLSLCFLSTTASEYYSIVTFAVNQGRDTRKQHNKTRSQEARMCHEQEHITERTVWSNKCDKENKEPKEKKIEEEKRNVIAAHELRRTLQPTSLWFSTQKPKVQFMAQTQTSCLMLGNSITQPWL